MSSGIGALQSSLERIAKKIPEKNKKVSVVFKKKDGTIDFPENCNEGILVVPAPMSEEEWELQNAMDD